MEGMFSETMLDRVWSGPHFAEVMFDGSVKVFLLFNESRSIRRRLTKKAAKRFDRMMDEIVEQAKKNVAARNSHWDEVLSRSL